MDKIIYRGIIFTKPDFEDEVHNRYRTTKAVLCGRIKHKPCEICGHEITIAHHEKYADFLNVRWLCHTDHRIIHSIFNKIDSMEFELMYNENQMIKNPESKELYQGWNEEIIEALHKFEVTNILQESK